MRIDTNELRRIALAEFVETDCLTGKYSPTADLRQCADELDRLYAMEDANKPMTREEIEAWLKEKGWVKSRFVDLWSHKNQTGEVSISDGFCRFSYNYIQLNLVTRALLTAMLDQ